MNATILLDLQRQVRALPATGQPVERVELFSRVGAALAAIPDQLVREFWLERFAAELETKHVDVDPLVCRVYLHSFMNAARKAVFA